jgi:hypothetical protein
MKEYPTPVVITGAYPFPFSPMATAADARAAAMKRANDADQLQKAAEVDHMTAVKETKIAAENAAAARARKNTEAYQKKAA